jgi:formylmethanofuran dehydrogenase subunit C
LEEDVKQMVSFKLIKEPELYLEAESISPNAIAGKSETEIKKLPAFIGNKQVTLGDYFEIKGNAGKTAAETSIIIENNVKNVFRIGQKMTNGEILIKGSCGMHLGSGMTGGKITVEGDAAEWAGAMMDGGEILIKGNAGNHCGSAYRGYWVGMNSGKIKVVGKIGAESGSWMRATKSNKKFPVIECGSADYYLGVHNQGGTIICEGDAEGRVGADMVEGQIIIKGKIKDGLLASFKTLSDVNVIQTPIGEFKGSFKDYEGDYAAVKKPLGHVYVAKK